MVWALLVAGTVAVVELFLVLPFDASLRRLRTAAVKSARTIASKRVSDHWKGKVLIVYSAQILLSSIRLSVLVVAVFSPIFVLGGVGHLVGADLFGLLATPAGVLAPTAGAVLYLTIRKRRRHAKV